MMYVRICRYISILMLFLLSPAGRVSAQTPEKLVSDIRSAAVDACVTVSYSLNARVDDVKIEDEGTVVAQDDLWCLKGESVHIYTASDGTWIMHLDSKEAMVEPKWTYADLEAFYKTLLSASSGNDVSIKVLSLTKSDKKPVSYFIPETGDDWIVTDLR